VKRWLQVVSRVGTVLVAVGLALLLVSLIPPLTTMSFSSGNVLAPETFTVLGPQIPPFGENASFYLQFISQLTPQQELKVDITCQGTVDAYILKTSQPNLMNSLPGGGMNTTALQDYLQVNPNVIGLQSKITDQGTIEYTPTEIINATVLLSNPSRDPVSVNYEGKIMSLLGPSGKTQMIAYVAIPVGFVLAAPWILDLSKKRPRKSAGTIQPQNAA
jgi:hypothetical protein